MGKMIFVNNVILQRDGRIWGNKKLHEILTNGDEEG